MGLALARGILSCPERATLVGAFPWSNHASEQGSRQDIEERHFRGFLHKQGIPILQAPGVNHYRFMGLLTALKPDLVLVGSWGEILQPHLLETPGIRFVNCHPSLLPFHRGANPYVAAVLSGETSSGITFHLIDKGIDTGPILLQERLEIGPTETGGSLRDRCAALAQAAVPKLLEGMAEGTLEPVPQEEKGSYDRITPEIGWVRWQDPPEAIERRIRALYPWFDNMALLEGRYPIRFRFGRLVASRGRPPAVSLKPGRILERTGGGVRVTTTDPERHLLLQSVRFSSHSRLWSGLLARLLLKPGRCFSDSPPPLETG